MKVSRKLATFLGLTSLLIVLAIVLTCLAATAETPKLSLAETISNSSIPESKPNLVSPIRLEKLSRGVDLTLWFWVDNTTDPPVKSPDHYQNYITEADLQSIKLMGFKHVRLSITPIALFQEATPTVLNPAVWPYLDKALDRIIAHDLAVIIDMHFDIEGRSFKDRLVSDPSFAEKYSLFWKTLAQQVSNKDPDMVFLEVLNEPALPDPQQWYTVQAQILAAMREGAPKNTLIADSNNQDAKNNPEPAGLLAMTPVPDPNVVYNMHFYEPQTFTGQGSASDGFATLSGLPYPYDAEACKNALDKITDTQIKGLATQYCTEQWDKAKLEGKLKQVSEWASKNGVNVMVNEFGAYYYGVPKASRLRWFEDVHTLFEKYSIGWTLWGYDDAYGLNHTADSGYMIDRQVLQALSLNTNHIHVFKPTPTPDGN